MTRTWHPGDVALVASRDSWRRASWATDCPNAGHPKGPHWHVLDSGRYLVATKEARPLVVIDPEDRQSVERLIVCLLGPMAGQVEIQLGGIPKVQMSLREYADPQPIKHAEVAADSAVAAMLQQVARDREQPYWKDEHADILDAAESYLQSLADHLGVTPLVLPEDVRR